MKTATRLWEYFDGVHDISPEPSMIFPRDETEPVYNSDKQVQPVSLQMPHLVTVLQARKGH